MPQGVMKLAKGSAVDAVCLWMGLSCWSSSCAASSERIWTPTVCWSHSVRPPRTRSLWEEA